MDNDYVAILYKIITYDKYKKIYLFIPFYFVDNCSIDIVTNILKLSSGKEYIPMESEKITEADVDVCYGFPMKYKYLKDIFLMLQIIMILLMSILKV